MTRVSVGLPVYNGEAYLEQSLTTLLEQTHADLEVVISDNASTDRTAAICQEFASVDPRIRYFRQPVNRGGAFNHTFVAQQATGPYFRWYSCDDWMGPLCIAECAQVLDQDKEVVLAWMEPTPIYSGEPRDEYAVAYPWDDRTPATRLRSLLEPAPEDSLIGMCTPIYGLVRREWLLDAMPMGAFYGSDHVILAHWALAGRWRRVEPGQFFLRRHDANSTANKPRHQVAKWMSPTMTPGRSMPEIRRFAAFGRAVAKTPMSVPQRLQCLGIVLSWPFRHRHWRFMAWDLRVLLGEIIGPRASSDDDGSWQHRVRRRAVVLLRTNQD